MIHSVLTQEEADAVRKQLDEMYASAKLAVIDGWVVNTANDKHHAIVDLVEYDEKNAISDMKTTFLTLVMYHDLAHQHGDILMAMAFRSMAEIFANMIVQSGHDLPPID
jgi:hypothetical protein